MMTPTPRPGYDEPPPCKCGHAKDDHDEYGCMHSSCQYVCKRYRSAANAKR